MQPLNRTFSAILLSLAISGCSSSAAYKSGNVTPPEPPREFRGVWVATVNNIDWPSERGLPVSQQKAELLALLDRAAELKLNAVLFQVRPACDALYASKIEPWSEYLTGTMGKAPAPSYDPLAFAIEEAHKRGLELHAWFNPYRALHFTHSGPVSSDHVSKTHPNIVRRYGRYLWLDPGEKETQDHSLRVVMDVVKRYGVDGIHFDDYFYPYAEQGEGGQDIPFPDEQSWKRYGASSGLSRSEWRRRNVDEFVERVYKAIKAEKPQVKFGISPFGIWRPYNPPQIKGYDAYDKLYADARKWLARGWVDYFAPQLYWRIDPPDQSFPVLLDWWNAQNAMKRHIWPGMNDSKAIEDWPRQEIPNQIVIAKKQPVSAGHIHWNMKALARSPNLMADLRSGAYAEPALVPALPWLASTNPPSPAIRVVESQPLKIRWTPGKGVAAAQWVVQYKLNGNWKTEILPGQQRSWDCKAGSPEAVAVRAVNRVGALSAAAGLTRQ